MSERVRIEHYEAESVRLILNDALETEGFDDDIRLTYITNVVAEDLVNRIGEIYERAMARQIVQAVRSQTK